MRNHEIRTVFTVWMLAVMLTLCALPAAAEDAAAQPPAIVSVTALGFLDYDGPKMNGVAVEYAEDLTGSDVNGESFSVAVKRLSGYDYLGDGTPGDVLRVYINDEPALSPEGGSGTGRYVIMELFTDYLSRAMLSFNSSLSVSVTQQKDIHLQDGGVLPASETAVSNSFGEKDKGRRFLIPDIAGFKWYTDAPGYYGADGPAYARENCFSMIDGTTQDVHLAYALCLPKDYREDGTYALMTVQNPAATPGTHPLQAVLASRTPAVYASDWAQQLVKDRHGVDGLIVLVPVITQRVNDNTGTPAEYEALVHLWDDVIAAYHVDERFIYGSGQSVGGMVVLDTNRNRDNFFAGMLLYEDQWAQNYYVDTLFARNFTTDAKALSEATMHYPRTDGEITWSYHLDTDGSPVYEGHDPYNYFYQISDDNILILNIEDNNLSNSSWREMSYLFSDLTGYQGLEQGFVDNADSLDKQNDDLRAWLNRENSQNIRWVTVLSGSTGLSVRKLDAAYEWVLSQSREEEIAREKLDLNKPFALAEEQDVSDGRILPFTDAEGNQVRYLTGARGAGTQFYNTSWLSTSPIADAVPGWLPEGMSWETGVQAARIQDVTPLSDRAFAVRYDQDMEGLVVRFQGDPVINQATGEEMPDMEIVMDPFCLLDADGNPLSARVENVYVSQDAVLDQDAARGQGSGQYVIVVFAQAPEEAPAFLKQLTTLRTNTVIASALPEAVAIADVP